MVRSAPADHCFQQPLMRRIRQSADSSWAAASRRKRSGFAMRASFHALNAWRHEHSKETAGRPSHSICTLLDEISVAPPMTLFVSIIRYCSS
jgi:hypothetical protein